MRVSDKAIILQAIRYGDKKHILKLYTRHNGLLTVAAATSKASSSKIKPAGILPLNLVSVELVLKQNKDVHQLTEVAPYAILNHIPLSLSKLTIAQFLNEILLKSLKEQSANLHLFEFIETCLRLLNDLEQDYQNLHLYFLTELTRYLGFEPQNNYSASRPFFDCRDGQFSPVCLALPLGLSKEDSVLFSGFLKTSGLHQKLTNSQRQCLLDVFLAYYGLHVPAFGEVKSLEVLRQVMAG